MAFTYNYKPMDYKTAQGQVAGQLDPLYNRAVQGVQQQKYQSDVQAGQVAAARGLGHSGLAADQLNKIAIASQGQVGDLEAQRASQMATMANDLMWKDKEFALQDRSQQYNEYNSDRGYNYQVGRDKIGDTRYADETKYNRGRDTLADNRYKTEWDYNVGRDKVADQRYNSETAYNHQRDANDDAWRQKEWSQMSPAEKARMAYAKKLGSGGGGGGGGGRRSSGRRSSGRSSSSSTSSGGLTDAYKQREKAKADAKYMYDNRIPNPNSGVGMMYGSMVRPKKW